MYMWQKSSVFSHESAQRNVAGHLIDKISLNQHGHFATNGFVFPLIRQMRMNHSYFQTWNVKHVSSLKIWMVHTHLPDEWKHETIGSEMTVLFKRYFIYIYIYISVGCSYCIRTTVMGLPFKVIHIGKVSWIGRYSCTKWMMRGK